MRRGEEAAKAQWGSLLALKKKIGIAEDYTPKQHGPYSSLSNARTVYVTDISFSGVEVDDKKWLMKKCNLKENSDISTQQIEQALYQLRGSQSYSSASYTLKETPEGYHLNFLLQENMKEESTWASVSIRKRSHLCWSMQQQTSKLVFLPAWLLPVDWVNDMLPA